MRVNKKPKHFSVTLSFFKFKWNVASPGYSAGLEAFFVASHIHL